MKTIESQIMNRRTIAASEGVKKLGPKEGRTIQVGNARLTWKATGADTGYATSLYEMDLPPGTGIPLHSHPYAEVFYVIAGYTDFLREQRPGGAPLPHLSSDPLPSSRDFDPLRQERLPTFSIVKIPLDRLANPLAWSMQWLPAELGLDLA
jgi:hypothetical protein